MDYVVELVVLGFDSIILLTCLTQYYKKKNAALKISTVPVLSIDKDLKEIVKSHPEGKLPYVALRGTVKALGNPIISSNNPQVSGVVQSLKIKEHVVQRNSTGFWADSERTIQEVHNVIPFSLESKGIMIEVIDPLVAEYLDMDVISDTFHPTDQSIMDHIWGFFAGVRQRGIQTTEKMLRPGTVMSGIGELVYEPDGALKLQPPSDGSSYFLTSMSIPTLIKKLENSKKKFGVAILILSAIGAVVSGILVHKYYKYMKKLKEDEDRKIQMEETRKRRRKLIRNIGELSDNQICVVCKSNPIESILLPCGHVCVCEDCAENISQVCPICRANVETKAAAYVM